MKKLLFSVFFIFLTLSTANAVTEEALPVACEKSKIVFEQLKAKKFKPVMIGNTKQITTMVFINTDKDMVVSVTLKVENEYMTCIFIAGENSAELF